jgi:hypothetical protein
MPNPLHDRVTRIFFGSTLMVLVCLALTDSPWVPDIGLIIFVVFGTYFAIRRIHFRPTFRLRSLFVLTAIVAVGCLLVIKWPRIAPRAGTPRFVQFLDGDKGAEIVWPTGRHEVLPVLIDEDSNLHFWTEDQKFGWGVRPELRRVLEENAALAK